MAESFFMEVLREGLWLALLVCAPPLLASVAAGLVSGALQAATQVQDPALSFVPRLVAVAVSLAAVAPWAGEQVARLARLVLHGLPGVG
jgi:flagellar biosynthesis protein FliQ